VVDQSWIDLGPGKVICRRERHGTTDTRQLQPRTLGRVEQFAVCGVKHRRPDGIDAQRFFASSRMFSAVATVAHASVGAWLVRRRWSAALPSPRRRRLSCALAGDSLRGERRSHRVTRDRAIPAAQPGTSAAESPVNSTLPDRRRSFWTIRRRRQ
jgi:hypothetical protein